MDAQARKDGEMKFPWGNVITNLVLDFDGDEMVVIKYHPNKYVNGSHSDGMGFEMDKISYSCPEINQSSDHLHTLVISWMVEKNLGHNNSGLVSGISRAIGISK